MPITLGLSLSSLTAQKNLNKATKELGSAYERLSSGLRINKSADDAAGLAIAESLRSDRRVYVQGVRNLNDGISLLSIADSAIDSLSTIVVRLKELAEQSSNGSYSSSQRKALDAEAQALSKEYTRIIQSTSYNGVSILNGGLGSGVRLQAGYGINGSILSGVGGAVGDGTFGNQITSTVALEQVRALHSVDFNGDGHLDLATADASSDTLRIALGNGDGTFRAPLSVQIGAVSNVTYGLEVVDVDLDGVMDLIGAEGNRLYFFKGNGDGTFQSRITSTVTGAASVFSIEAGDFNGDGQIDVAGVDAGGNRLHVMTGNGTGSFSHAYSVAVPIGPISLVSGDFNSDGKLDLATANGGNDSISVLIGNGNGSFLSPVSYGTGILPNEIEVGDLNGDGILDLFTADSTTNTVSVFLGRGNGTFASRVSYTTGTGPSTVKMGDFNGDGIVDLTTSNYGSATVSVLLGRGGGTFGAATSYVVGDAYTTDVADYNEDGVMDIVSVGFWTGQAYTLLGRTREGTSSLAQFSLATAADAKQALSLFSQKVNQLAKQRGQIGASQSRIGVALNNLQAAADNFAAAESRIRDADIAEDTAKIVRLQILQQASTAVLAQANLQPQIALSLLQDARVTGKE